MEVNGDGLEENGEFDAVIIILKWVNRDESTSFSRIASLSMTLELQLSDSKGEI